MSRKLGQYAQASPAKAHKDNEVARSQVEDATSDDPVVANAKRSAAKVMATSCICCSPTPEEVPDPKLMDQARQYWETFKAMEVSGVCSPTIPPELEEAPKKMALDIVTQKALGLQPGHVQKYVDPTEEPH